MSSDVDCVFKSEMNKNLGDLWRSRPSEKITWEMSISKLFPLKCRRLGSSAPVESRTVLGHHSLLKLAAIMIPPDQKWHSIKSWLS